MSVSFELNAEVREAGGKLVNRRLRRLEDKVPAVVYGANKDPISITLNHNEVLKALENEAFYSHILTLNVAGGKSKTEKVVVKDIQRHVYKPKVVHMDFLRVSATEKLHIKVPLHFIGDNEAIGVKDEGGIIYHSITEVEIACLPQDLPEFLEVNVSQLKLGESLHLSDITLPKGVELVELSHGSEHDQAIVSIQLPRKVEEEPLKAAAEATGGDAAEESKPENDE